MHLRGPMNVSRLAVYQVPSEAYKMRKRSTVPFYNRRRALRQRQHGTAETNFLNHANHVHPLDERTWTTAANCSSLPTITSTVYLTDCRKSTALPNVTYIGPPLPCLPAPGVQPANTSIAPTPSPTRSNCTCQSPTAATDNLERHPRPTSTLTHPLTSIVETHKVRKRAAAWDRVAYYTSVAPAQATGLSFLANLGDPRKSGTFD
jgi:hypothetical protein